MQKRIDELLLSGKSIADVVRIVSNETGKSKQNIRYHVNKIKDRNKAGFENSIFGRCNWNNS